MNYSLLKYPESKYAFNIGDYIQSLAAKQFLPHVDNYINREELNSYKGEQTNVILNGWFTHNVYNWIPSREINPLFISFHINHSAAPIMLTDEAVTYLKKHEPIGCRDQYTADLLLDKGVNAYFSGCLTLTLDNYKVSEEERGEDVYIVDPLYGYANKQKVFSSLKRFIRSLLNGQVLQIGKKRRHLRKIFSKSIWTDSIHINHELPAGIYTHEQKFEMAEELLRKYAKAKLVITSRIHCALPCLAMGTPVIFINGFDAFIDTCRFDGIIDLFNRVDVNTKTGEFTANFPLSEKITKDLNIQNLEKHYSIANGLKESCNNFISRKK